jgi:PEP-CTERM motif
MKNFLACFALALLAATIPSAHADTMSDGLTITINGAAVVGVYNPTLHELVFTDVLTDTSVLHHSLLSTTVSTITATYTDISGVLGNLSVVDACVSTTVFGSSNAPCSDVSLVATETGIGPLHADLGTLTLIGANINLGFDHFAPLATVDIGSATGNLQFNTPAPSPVPEPGSLSLMATGLLGAAGALRRKFTDNKK